MRSGVVRIRLLHSVEGIRRSHEDVEAGRSRPATEFLADMLQKHGIQD
jgi:hypothetical protein